MKAVAVCTLNHNMKNYNSKSEINELKKKTVQIAWRIFLQSDMYFLFLSQNKRHVQRHQPKMVLNY